MSERQLANNRWGDDNRRVACRKLLLEQRLHEGVEVTLQVGHQLAIENLLFLIDKVDVAERLMVAIHQDERKGMEDGHLVDLRTQGIQTSIEDGSDLVVEVLLTTVDPLLHDTTVDLVVIVVVGEEIARLLTEFEMDVGKHSIPVGGIFGDDLAYGTINLQNGLFCCVQCFERLKVIGYWL